MIKQLVTILALSAALSATANTETLPIDPVAEKEVVVAMETEVESLGITDSDTTTTITPEAAVEEEEEMDSLDRALATLKGFSDSFGEFYNSLMEDTTEDVAEVEEVTDVPEVVDELTVEATTEEK